MLAARRPTTLRTPTRHLRRCAGARLQGKEWDGDPGADPRRAGAQVPVSRGRFGMVILGPTHDAQVLQVSQVPVSRGRCGMVILGSTHDAHPQEYAHVTSSTGAQVTQVAQVPFSREG